MIEAGAPRARRSRRSPPGTSSGPAARRACGRPRGGTGSRTARARRPPARRPATRVELASAVKPGGGSNTVSRCDIQHDCSAGVPASSRPGSATVSCERPNSPTSAPSTRPPSVQDQRLHAVTDAEHGDPELEQRRIQPRRARRRTPTPGRRTGSAPSARRAHLLDADVVRQQLARTRRTRARGARSAASTARRSRARRPRRSRPRARAPAPRGAGRPRRPTRARAERQLSLRQAPLAPPRAPMPTCWSRCSCLPSVCSAGAIISSARLNSAMSW